MGMFTYKLEQENRTPADPPVLHTAGPDVGRWDTIPLTRDKTLRVVEVLLPDRDPDEEPVLVVKPS
jgi:hypothetical protein